MNYTISEKDLIDIINKDRDILECLGDLSDEVIKTAIKYYPYNIELIKNQPEEFCLMAVRNKGHTLQYVKNQSINVQKEAIRQNYDSFRYAKDILSNPEVQIELAKQINKIYSIREFSIDLKRCFNLTAKKFFLPETQLFIAKQAVINSSTAKKFLSPKYFEMYLKYKDCKDLIE